MREYIYTTFYITNRFFGRDRGPGPSIKEAELLYLLKTCRQVYVGLLKRLSTITTLQFTWNFKQPFYDDIPGHRYYPHLAEYPHDLNTWERECYVLAASCGIFVSW